MTGHIRYGLILLTLFLLAIGSCAAQPGANDLLKRSLTTDRNCSFEGRLRTTIYGARVTTADAEIVNDRGRSRMRYLTGPSAGTTIVDAGGLLVRLAPSERTAYVSEPPKASGRLDLLFSNYNAKQMGAATVAGRDCRIVKLEPRASGNPWKTVWVDRVTYVPLRTEQYNASGRLIARTEYLSADFRVRLISQNANAVPKGWKTVRMTSACMAKDLNGARKLLGFAPTKPGYVPRGYVFEGYSVCTPCKSMKSAAMRYTNGLNTISVFESKGDCGMGGCSKECIRACKAGGCMMSNSAQAGMAHTEMSGLSVTVVADLSSGELRRIAKSIH